MAGKTGAKSQKKLSDDVLYNFEKLVFKCYGTSKICVFNDQFNDFLNSIKMPRAVFIRRYYTTVGKTQPLDFNVFKYDDRFKEKIPVKSLIFFECEECKNSCVIQRGYIFARRFGDVKICGACHTRKRCRMPEARKNNSEAQKIAQNREEVKEKNRFAQKQRFKDQAVRELYSKNAIEVWKREGYRQKISSKMRELWKDPEYVKKTAWNGRSKYTGFYKGIFYQSLTELSFILWKFDSGVKRYDKRPISYRDEAGSHSYYPDFEINDLIIEVKGSLKGYYGDPDKAKNIQIKAKAAFDFCKLHNLKYRIVVGKDIPKEYHTLARKLYYGKDSKEDV